MFYAFAAVTVIGAMLVVSQKNPVYSVLSLILAFFGLAGLYVLLEAPFVAVVQIIIYAGAIMVLFLFVVMLLNVGHEDALAGGMRAIGGAGPRRFGAVLSLVLLGELVWALSRLQGAPLAPRGGQAAASVGTIGLKLFRDYAFAFEATSVLILVAMVGAIVLARKERP